MIRLFIIADDFTGALDTGVQLAAQGACTRIITNPAADLSAVAPEVEVLVLDAETRHLSAAQAAGIVGSAVRQAVRLGVPNIYKKTDSALRGNIGAELTAVLRESGRSQLPFLPAFPQIGRRTQGGVHYIGDTPVAESVFGQDPFEPVTRSCVAELIAQQSDVPVRSLPAPADADGLCAEPGIVVYDAAAQEELERAGRLLMQADALHVMAGCAGFGAVLPQLLGLGAHGRRRMPQLDERLLVLCGSVNPITLAQLDAAQQSGFARLRMTPAQKLTPDYFASPEGLAQIEAWKQTLHACDACIIDANDEGGNEPTAAYAKAHGLTIEDLRQGISGALGLIMKGLFDCPDLGTLLITGGDTLLQCMNRIGIDEMEPIGELYAGVVLSRFTLGGRSRFVISKSGGFGEPTLLCDLLSLIRGAEKKPAD